MDARKPSASAIAAQVDVARAARVQRAGEVADGEHDADGDERDARVMQHRRARGDAGREDPAPGAKVQKLAWPSRGERIGAPSATGRSW